jgi:hypothetical protein
MLSLTMLVSVPRRSGSKGFVSAASWWRVGRVLVARRLRLVCVLAADCSPHATPSWWQHCNENGFAPHNVVDRVREVRKIAFGFNALTPNAVS